MVAVKQDVRALAYASNELRNDKQVAMVAVKQDVRALKYISDELIRSDKEMLIIYCSKQDPRKNNSELLRHIKNASTKLKNDIDVIMVAVKLNWQVMQYFSIALRANKEVVIFALKQSGLALQYACDEFKNDKEVVMFAVKNNSDALEHASDELKNDTEIVTIAVAKNWDMLQFASAALQTFLTPNCVKLLNALIKYYQEHNPEKLQDMEKIKKTALKYQNHAGVLNILNNKLD